MGTFEIRDLDPRLKARLNIRATRNGRSMEDEAADIIRQALSAEPASGQTLVEVARAAVQSFGGVDLELPQRGPIREPPDFGS
ncbi:plasmid stabilization protein [Methyloversatilis sp.]|uniref:FitA-like ribbon-helix-helix domain-containing protein n=1 Tax=Methyloversatilis sp. TaxID=2569862 RepID=UPI00273748DE|nr:plasmid stabilization protein [Methyloversatilis sp.]MDP2870326.1 plasmid stabilization protein [Methyloversatilis sp.]MDP3454403.1 plasmid stabilization protein [Methyloversatilis sp.]MDP3578731.1 plasmid stabilization protein [Methyloversatilis sp.]MDP3872855.1 plasmid stabilization protein [Methyloversatilis sp.]